MSLDWQFKVDEATHAARREAYPATEDGTMNSVTFWLIMSTMNTRCWDFSTVDKRDEAFRRIAFYEALFGAVCQTADGPRPITREDVEAHRGLITNAFPTPSWNVWVRDLTKHWAAQQTHAMHSACRHGDGFCTVAYDGVPEEPPAPRKRRAS